MIVPMKRFTILCLLKDRDPTMDALSRLGVLHLTSRIPPEGKQVEQAHKAVWHIKRALEELPREPSTPPSRLSAEEVVEKIWRVIRRRRTLREELEALKTERGRLAPLGDFDPGALRALAEQGIFVKLYAVTLKQELPVPDGASVEEVGRDSKNRYLAVISTRPIQIDADEERWPDQSLSEVNARIASIRDELKKLQQERETCYGDNEKVADHMREARQTARLLQGKAMMQKSGPVAFIRGFAPAESTEAIQRAAEENGWGLVFDEPKPTDPVPTLIRNPSWVKPIRVIFDFINITPGYREVDISGLFLIFFGLFFAMIVGDAGYGVIYLALTLIGWKTLPQAPKILWQLLLVMSIATIVWGLLTGNVFGMATLPAVIETVRIPWLMEQDNVMLLCFLIGAVHLTLAHGWNAIRAMNSLRALAQIGWICTTWVMFFVARTMVLGKSFPPILMAVLGLGVLLIVLFMTPLARLKAEWFNHVMLPLNLISNFVDVVSYVRLFAVGMATFAMASAFNEMAGGMMGGVGGGIAAALLLFLGHTLNILLATMGVLVHGIRLNTLEFSGHLGLEWSGVRYDPLVRDPKLKS